MDIKQTLESLSIETTDDILFSKLQAVMKKNFSKTLGQKDKIISFYDENEKIQRKYFFKFITKIYNETHSEKLEIKFAEYKTIKLFYKQQNSLKITIVSDVEFYKDEVKFSFERPSGLFISYISQKFKNSQIFINEKQTSLIIKIRNKSDIIGFDELFSKNEHMHFWVSFKYDFDKFINFKRNANIQNSQKIIRRRTVLSELFMEHFNALKCEPNDSFEDVRGSYLKLVKLYHPDRHANKSEKIKRNYRLKFEKIQTAYESLKPYFREQGLSINAG